MSLYALTLHRPWSWAICAGWKPVENRDWRPPRHVIGKWIAIHSGSTYDAEGMAFVRRLLPAGVEAPLGGGPDRCIIGVARLAGFVTVRDDQTVEYPEGELGEKLKAILEARPGWLFGKYGWVFDEAVGFEQVIPARGHQKLWAVPEYEHNLCQQRYRAALGRAA